MHTSLYPLHYGRAHPFTHPPPHISLHTSPSTHPLSHIPLHTHSSHTSPSTHPLSHIPLHTHSHIPLHTSTLVLLIVIPCSIPGETFVSVDANCLHVLLSFALAHGNVNSILDCLQILMGRVSHCGSFQRQCSPCNMPPPFPPSLLPLQTTWL